MAESKSPEDEESASILRLLASDGPPPTGETMDDFSQRVKTSVRRIGVDEFLTLAQQQRRRRRRRQPICDARSPGEFAIGHIPGATSLPLFSDDERARVGTTYASEGREEAMVVGMGIVRPKMDGLVEMAKDILAVGNDGEEDRGEEGDAKNVLLLHCWRGGMRSCALAFLVQTRIPNLTVYVLDGGYRAFRRWQYTLYCYLPPNANYDPNRPTPSSHPTATNNGTTTTDNTSHRQRSKLATRATTASGPGIALRAAAISRARALRSASALASTAAADSRRRTATAAAACAAAEWATASSPGPRIAIVGGPTGSGKTRVLHALAGMGEQVIDLEGLACHSGSAFGFVGHGVQPTPQQFMNEVAVRWRGMDSGRWVFLEDEGPHVGRVNLPVGLYRRMRAASAVLKLDVPKEVRVRVLREDYALPERDSKDGGTEEDSPGWLSDMINATRTLEKRIGRVRMEAMIALLRDGDYAAFASVALEYYDDLYDRHLANEHGSANMEGEGGRAGTISTVVVDGMERFDAEAVARQVLVSLEEAAGEIVEG